jgi:hypothetical protein
MLDRLQCIGADLQRHRLAKRIADEMNLAKIGQETPLRLVVGVTHGVTDKDALIEDRSYTDAPSNGQAWESSATRR